MLKKLTNLAIAAGMLAIFAAPALAASVLTTPPAGFKRVSDLVKLPYFMPGYGVLYVNPSTLPVGPFLGYDHKSKLVQVLFMIPLSGLNAHKNWENLGDGILPQAKINHVDIDFNPGHPGVEFPHYHVALWLLPHALHGSYLK